MKITKFIHSCTLVEYENTTVLIDPGNYSYESGAFDIGALEKLDYIIITHDHQDHFHLPFVSDLIAAFSPVTVIATQSVVNILGESGIPAVTSGNEFITVEQAHHEKILAPTAPSNISVTLWDTFTHPGDSLRVHRSGRIFALPIQAPWGSMVSACEKAVSLRPEIVIPIHDWHWSDAARVALYKTAYDYFASQNIRFIEIESGKPIEL